MNAKDARDTDRAEDRIRELLDRDSDRLMGILPTGSDKSADYWLAVVDRDHPDAYDSRILMIRYVRLPEAWSDAEDTFMRNGINIRRKEGDADLPRNLAQILASTSAQIGADTLGDREVLKPDSED